MMDYGTLFQGYCCCSPSMIPCSSPTYSAPAAAACMSDFDPLLILDKKANRDQQQAIKNSQTNKSEDRQKEEQRMELILDYGQEN